MVTPKPKRTKRSSKVDAQVDKRRRVLGIDTPPGTEEQRVPPPPGVPGAPLRPALAAGPDEGHLGIDPTVPIPQYVIDVAAEFGLARGDILAWRKGPRRRGMGFFATGMELVIVARDSKKYVKPLG